MSFWGAGIGAIVGLVAAPFTGGLSLLGMGAAASSTVLGGLAGHMFYDQPEIAKTEASKTRKEAEKWQAQQQQQRTLEAGEYYKLNKEQMQIQALRGQTQTLVDLITREDSQPPAIYTLPTAQPTAPVTRINQAIADFFRGV